MKRLSALILSIVLAAVMLAGCAIDKSGSEPKATGGSGTNDVQKPYSPGAAQPLSIDVSGKNFDRALLDYMGGYAADENFALSPLSFLYALGLLYEGCAGETKAELKNALVSLGIDDLPGYLEEFNRVAEDIAAAGQRFKDEAGNDILKLELANSVWKRGNIAEEFKKAYKEAIALYGAEYYSFNRDNVIGLVNEWADKKTHGLIPRLLPDNYDTSDLAVILMNALYLKDAWSDEFTEVPQIEFKAKDGTVVKKDAIQATESFGYYEDNETVIIVVRMLRGLEYVIVQGSTDGLDEKMSRVNYEGIKLTMPVFEIETSWMNHEFENLLSAAGVNLIFTDGADFTAMIDHELAVSDIVQKVKISVNKEGIEAAAVTAIMVNDSAIYFDEIREVVVDEPFTFFVETSGGVVLFEGQLVK